VLPIDIEKLTNVAGQFLAKMRRVSIQDSKGCCTFQLSLVYNRVCWDSFSATAGFSVLKNVLGGPRDFPGIFWGPGRTAGWFLRGFGVQELGEGRLG
jgi:hypothetical protein